MRRLVFVWLTLSLFIAAAVPAYATQALWASEDGGHAIKADGYLWHWGDGSSYTYPPPARFVTDPSWRVVSSNWMTMAVADDGRLWSLGMGSVPYYQTPVLLSPTSDWTTASSAYSYRFAIRDDGTLWGWGQNFLGQVGDGTYQDVPSMKQIGAGRLWADVTTGGERGYAITRDGDLWGWGWGIGPSPVLFDDTGVWDCLIDGAVGRKRDGTWYSLGTTGVSAFPGQPWEQVSVGGGHVLALKDDGSLWAWGANDCCQLGTGDSNDRYSPVQIGSKTDWVLVDAGRKHSYAIDSAGMVWGWGGNWNGQLAAKVPEFGTVPAPIFSTTDLLPPRTTQAVSSTHPELGRWYNTSVCSIDVTATDETAVRGFSYVLSPSSASSVDGVIDSLGPKSVILPTGRSTVGVRAVDYGGNPGPVEMREFLVDLGKPTVALPVAPVYGDKAVLTATGIDSMSGVASVTFVVDSGQPVTVAGASPSIEVTGTGRHTVSAWSTDLAGNKSTPVAVSFDIRTAPSFHMDASGTVAANRGQTLAIRGRVLRRDGTAAPGTATLCIRGSDGVLRPVSTAVPVSADGGFELALRVERACAYAVRFTSSDSNTASAESPSVAVKLRMPVSRPRVARVARVGVPVVAEGLLGDAHRTGDVVGYVEIRKWEDGHWRAAGSAPMCAVGLDARRFLTRRYVATLTFPESGVWRLRAVTPEDEGHVAGASTDFSRVVVVR